MDIYVGKADIGKIIGRQGRIAKALRAVVKAAAAKQGKRYNIAIKEKESKKEVSEDAIDEVVDKVVGDSAE
jgi:predicted RNA-binding protein Jag